MLPQTAYQIVLDEVMLDGNARFNLATFVTTWMDEEADRLYAATFDKNMIDKDEYPQTADIEARCVRMLDDLWHAPHGAESVGTSTTGSSEGCMLAGLALKRRWQQARRTAGHPTDRPNIVMGGNVQVVWEKFANYWEVEPRYVPLEGDVFHLTAERMRDHVDENTIDVVAVLGSTMDGSYEPVRELTTVPWVTEPAHSWWSPLRQMGAPDSLLWVVRTPRGRRSRAGRGSTAAGSPSGRL
jgi:glutamate decarboxylase